MQENLLKKLQPIQEWYPCKSTVSRIFKNNGWSRRKSQQRNPMSDPHDKDDKIENFKKKLKDLIEDSKKPGKTPIKRKNVHMMDETGLFSDSIPPYTWTFHEDTQAYVCSSGIKRRDTLVATITANGKGFATFIKHRNQKTKTVKKQKIIVDPGCKGMNIVEMKIWINEFKKYASPGDILIMDNLSSHHNKDVINELEQYGIHVLFIPPRCADVLSVLDNCFFAVFKAKWYEELISAEDVDSKKRRAIDLFDSLIATNIGKRMYKHCGYDDFFDQEDKEEDIESIIERNENEDEGSIPA